MTQGHAATPKSGANTAAIMNYDTQQPAPKHLFAEALQAVIVRQANIFQISVEAPVALKSSQMDRF